MSVGEAFAALGSGAVFAPGCFDRSGRAVTGPVNWRGLDLVVIAPVAGGRLMQIRLHEQLSPMQNSSAAKCLASKDRYLKRLGANRARPVGSVTQGYDGPIYRWRQSVDGGGAIVAAYRPTRRSCQVWLELAGK
jgi:hypothetical protein